MPVDSGYGVNAMHAKCKQSTFLEASCYFCIGTDIQYSKGSLFSFLWADKLNFQIGCQLPHTSFLEQMSTSNLKIDLGLQAAVIYSRNVLLC